MEWIISMQILLIILMVCLVFSLIGKIIEWFQRDDTEIMLRKQSEKQIERIDAKVREDFEKKYYRTNVLVLSENLECNKAYFKNQMVYAVTKYGDYEIGYFDELGNVYSTDKMKIAKIQLTNDFEGFIHLSRLDELEELKRRVGDEQYYATIKKMNYYWTCAEVDYYGHVIDWVTEETIAKRDFSTSESEKNAIGYGACFACLQYQTGAHGKYADFYNCPIGTRYEPKKIQAISRSFSLYIQLKNCND